MSTLKTTFIQHPSAAEPSIELSSDGSIVLPLSGIGDLADVDEGSGAADGDVLTYDGVGNVWSPVALSVPDNAFDSSVTITATNASWPVPTLGNPIVKVTAVGAGGGGGGVRTGATTGATGGTSTFDAGSGISVSAAGGVGGRHAIVFVGASGSGVASRVGLTADNGGGGGIFHDANQNITAERGFGGEVRIAYLDLTGVSTVNVTVGAGGAGGTASFNPGAAGGRGEVIVEYKAA